MNQPIRTYQIEQLLLNAHLEREVGVDLIEEYFSGRSSLDEITKYANELLEQTNDQKTQEAIIKNLSECIVVKMQQDRRSIVGSVKQYVEKLGFHFKKSPEVIRAEKLIKKRGG